jgi:hypothetical protein
LSAVGTGDFNGDSRLDLAVANAGSDNVTILIGTGDGTFGAEAAPSPVGDNPNGITAADFDGDGRPDLAVSNTSSSTVSVLLRNPANNGFVEGLGSPIAVGTFPAQIATADFDRNGTPDIAVAASGGLEILKRGGAGFVRDTPTPVSGSPSGVAVADFNADTLPDAAVSSYGTNQVTAPLSPSPAQPPTPTPTSTPTPTLDAPRAGEVNVLPVSGKVRIKLKGSDRYVDLTDGLQVEVGASVDTREGRVTIIGPGTSDKADFFDGIFKLSQAKGLTTLTLTQSTGATTRASPSSRVRCPCATR